MESHNEIVEKFLNEYETEINYTKSKDSHAEVFDKHPITAMSEMDPNSTDRVLIITDSWTPDWCRDGVQVPVKSANEQKKSEIKHIGKPAAKTENFIMPEKLIRHTRKYEFLPEKHCHMPEMHEFLYEIDPIDSSWIEISNVERKCLGLQLISETMLEIIFEILERLCYKRIQSKVREAETEFLEHDENSKCDVCQSPEGEDGNELVFCEDCFVCVHQACYGIPELPSGSWICRHCDKCPNESSQCILCPNRGGAMKQLESDEDKWAHLSCAVWIPEVGFGNIDLMEPITRLNTIPQARWNLRCHLCKTSNTGAPIQCSEKKCKMAFHVTCAIQNSLVMKQEFQANMDVKLLAYCKQHSKKYQEPNTSESSVNMGPRDIKELRIQKQKEFEQKFSKFVNAKELSETLHEFPKQLIDPLKSIPSDIKDKIFTYWTLKRTSNHFQCLIKPPSIWSEENLKQRINNRSIMNAFCKIRFGLDRARLVVDMMVRREKKKAHLFELMSKISSLQLEQLKNSRLNSILKDDPSLAGNWGFISTVHLDDNVYVNPDNLLDVNLEYVMNKMNLTKPESLEPHKQLLEYNVFDEKPMKTVRKYTRKPQMIPTNNPVSIVSNIPKEQLLISSKLKTDIYEKLKEPIFICHYLMPNIQDLLLYSMKQQQQEDNNEDGEQEEEDDEDKLKKQENEISLANELPEDSDSSSNSILDISTKVEEKIFPPAPKKVCVKICNEENQLICRKSLPSRNIFDMADKM